MLSVCTVMLSVCTVMLSVCTVMHHVVCVYMQGASVVSGVSLMLRVEL